MVQTRRPVVSEVVSEISWEPRYHGGQAINTDTYKHSDGDSRGVKRQQEKTRLREAVRSYARYFLERRRISLTSILRHYLE